MGYAQGGGGNSGLGEEGNPRAPPLYTSLQYILVGVVEVNKILYVSDAINACSYNGSNDVMNSRCKISINAIKKLATHTCMIHNTGKLHTCTCVVGGMATSMR